MEKRQFPRFKIRLPVRFRILDKERKTYITNDTDAHLEDVSKGGMRLSIPHGWDCPECNNCLGWAYNLDCDLKNGHTREVSRCLTANFQFEISLNDPKRRQKGAVTLDGESVWVDQPDHPDQNTYPGGISLSKQSQNKISSYLPHIFSI